MGQCTEIFKAKLRGIPTFQSIEDDNNVIVFICGVKEAAFKLEAHRNTHVSLWNMKKRTVNMYHNHLDPVKLLKNGQKSDSFAAHFVHHFNNTTSCTDLHKCMAFKVINQLNPIGAMKTFTKPNCNLCMQERLTILKKLREKRVTVMNKNSEIYGACRHKTNFHQFSLSTDDTVFNR